MPSMLDFIFFSRSMFSMSSRTITMILPFTRCLSPNSAGLRKMLWTSAFRRPLPGQDTYLQLDGGTYKVVDATDECGIYAITLEANRSR